MHLTDTCKGVILFVYQQKEAEEQATGEYRCHNWQQ